MCVCFITSKATTFLCVPFFRPRLAGFQLCFKLLFQDSNVVSSAGLCCVCVCVCVNAERRTEATRRRPPGRDSEEREREGNVWIHVEASSCSTYPPRRPDEIRQMDAWSCRRRRGVNSSDLAFYRFHESVDNTLTVFIPRCACSGPAASPSPVLLRGGGGKRTLDKTAHLSGRSAHQIFMESPICTSGLINGSDVELGRWEKTAALLRNRPRNCATFPSLHISIYKWSSTYDRH